MNCKEVQDFLAEYWELSAQDEKRHRMERHLMQCSACAEEFRMWKVSRELIQSSQFTNHDRQAGRSPIASGVMERIYAEETWRVPLASRAYRLTGKIRRNAMMAIALFLGIFIVSFFYSVVIDRSANEALHEFDGIFPIANAAGEHNATKVKSGLFEGIPVASISAPNVLRMGPIQTYPDYLLAVSLLGLIFTLLLLNWLSRIRA